MLIPCITLAAQAARVKVAASQGMSAIAAHDQVDSLNNAAFKLLMSRPALARELAQKALLLARRQRWDKGIGESFLNIGKTYWTQNHFHISLFSYSTALTYLQRTRDSTLLSDCYRCLGRNYIDLKTLDAAPGYLDKALHYAGKDDALRELALRERSQYFIYKKQFDRALADINVAMAISRKADRKISLGVLYARLLDLSVHKGQLTQALTYADTAIQLSYAANNKRLRAVVLVDEAGIYLKQGRQANAIKLGKEAATLARAIGNTEVYKRASRLLYEIYAHIGNKDMTLKYQHDYIAMQDSLSLLSAQSNTRLIQEYLALNSKLHSIDKITHQNEVGGLLIRSQRITIINLAVTVLILTILMYVLYRSYRSKNRLSKQLHAEHQEVTEQKRLIELQSRDLNELNLQKNNLLAIIGHDLRTPMANINMIIELFEEQEVDEQEVKNLIRDMAPAIKGAELTLNNLMDWAGSQIRGAQINITRVDVTAVVKDTLSAFTLPLSRKQIATEVRVPAEAMVMADEYQLKTILRNFLSNAIKFTPDQGAICIYAEPKADRWIIAVKDTGKGMTEADIDRLFKASSHFSKTGTRGEKGSGIGLLLCRQLAEANGGTIGASSNGGQGGVFYVSLPAAVLITA
ncbi:hypothetical protein LLH06_15120 [Mucilaginibacter daejeonensis]|uniref:ATP-binding protein n=1 Tax=Mucilaginibacter daejeonensis TaxID=398049 RepID=UPI001D17C95E|nr:ATP-binding protein [Mucilaginibacter daejeonensis]UEG52295.1 hypothetical protein LLH06_15120 [Mucilaginibacter daejeonensis]